MDEDTRALFELMANDGYVVSGHECKECGAELLEKDTEIEPECLQMQFFCVYCGYADIFYDC